MQELEYLRPLDRAAALQLLLEGGLHELGFAVRHVQLGGEVVP